MNSPPSSPATASFPDCVELGVWTPIPQSPPADLVLHLKQIAPDVSQAIKDRQTLSFHAVGCTGCHADQQATTQVAQAMAVQAVHPYRFGGTPAAVPISFLYHLGDVVYKKDKDTAGDQSPLPPPEHRKDFGELYDRQFYGPFAAYGPLIFAVAGNHDGKDKDPDGPSRKSAIQHFLENFCGLADGASDNQSSNRPAMRQPYPYWVLKTPLAYFVGLYTNVCNAGQLDDPEKNARPQYDWLVQTLKDIKKAADRPALFLVLHYPPYSAAANFLERGDPNLGPTPRPPGKTLDPLGRTLQAAFRDSGQFPDVVLSAHAHHYQRLTYTYESGRQIPYLIAGGGGHIPVEPLSKPCQNQQSPVPATPPRVVYPPRGAPPASDRVELVAANDRDFGFLRLTLDGTKQQLTGEHFAAFNLGGSPKALPALDDSFTLDLRTHSIR
jgi:hypothetical protein